MTREELDPSATVAGPGPVGELGPVCPDHGCPLFFCSALVAPQWLCPACLEPSEEEEMSTYGSELDGLVALAEKAAAGVALDPELPAGYASCSGPDLVEEDGDCAPSIRDAVAGAVSMLTWAASDEAMSWVSGARIKAYREGDIDEESFDADGFDILWLRLDADGAITAEVPFR
jgi:hypothetical protein